MLKSMIAAALAMLLAGAAAAQAPTEVVFRMCGCLTASPTD